MRGITKLTGILLLLNYSLCFSQERFTLSGTITDGSSGEFLIGASVYIVSVKSGVVANEYGFYSITIPRADSITIVFNYLGFKPQIKKIAFNKDYKIDVKMELSAHGLKELEVTGNRNAEKNVEKAQMGVVDIPIEKIKSMPAIFGESDVLKVIQLLPGVQSGNEGTTGFFVRGGNADQNLVVLDEATVYNPNHLFGLFSTFNTRALNNVVLVKGGFPAQYGGRLSSILDIKMKEGNKKDYIVQGGVGLISSQLTVEGPIKKEKASFIVSGRRTYLDVVLKPFLKKGIETKYHFYDLNAKVNWEVSPNNRLFLSGFKGNDNAIYKESKGINYGVSFGNSAATLRWNHIFNKQLFLKTSVVYNTYYQNISTTQDNSYAQTYAGIRDVTANSELQFFPIPAHQIIFGGGYTIHRFITGGRSESIPGNKAVPDIDIKKLTAKYFNEFAIYVNDEFTISRRVSLNYGVRAPGFTSSKANYFKVEPRATIKLSVDSSSSIKAAYTMMNQFLHLIPSSTAALPTDIWIPSSEKTKPQFSTQYALGYFRNFSNNLIESSVEVYYKDMDNQVLFNEGNKLNLRTDVDNGLVYGKGESYGLELFLKKNTGQWSGWISYTLSWTNQKFKDLNFGKEFPFKYDRRHALSLTASYQLNNKWTFNGVFVFSSGGAFTVPTGRFSATNAGSIFEGTYFIYEGRNNYRLHNYHRLDLSATHKKVGVLFKKPFEREWVFGLYNAYSRLNPYFVYFKIDPLTDQPVAKQVSLLPVIPSISYNFKF